jgi:hypothetical protein
MGDEYVRADEVAALIAAEREACAAIVRDRIGVEGYGVAQTIRNRK